MAEKKKGSLLGKLVLLVFLVVIIGVPAHMVHFGKFKSDEQGQPMLGAEKWPWQFSSEDWNVYWGSTKKQAQDIKEQATEKWGELKVAAKEKWTELRDKIAHKTDKTEELFVNREVVLKEMEALEGTLPAEASRNAEQKSIGWGITAFQNSLKEWETSLMWNKSQADGSTKRAMDQLDKAVANFTDAAAATTASITAADQAVERAKGEVSAVPPSAQDPLIAKQKQLEEAAKVAKERAQAVSELLKWAKEYQADFKARTDLISGS